MSNALLEAMACGLACIATPVGGNIDLITDGETGLLVPARSPKALVKAMVAVADDPDLRQHLGREAARRVREQYSIEAVASQYVAAYRRLCKM